MNVQAFLLLLHFSSKLLYVRRIMQNAFLEQAMQLTYFLNLVSRHDIPRGLMARIPGFHPGGPGSIPGVGDLILCFCQQSLTNSSHLQFALCPLLLLG